MTSRWRRFLIVLGAAAGIAVAAALLLSVAGARLLADFLEAALSTPPHTVVRIADLKLRSLGDVRFTGVTVADADGVWLDIPDLALAWSPRRLLDGKLQVQNLAAATVTVWRWPKGGGKDGGWPPKIAWPALPLDLEVEKLKVSALTLPSLDSRALPPLTAEGRLRLDDQVLVGAVAAFSSIGDRLALAVDGARRAETLKLNLKVVSDDKGTLTDAARAAGLRGLAGIAITVTGDGPWRAWRGKITARLAGLGDFSGWAAVDGTARLLLAGRLQAAPGLSALLTLPPAAAVMAEEPADLNLALLLDEEGAARAIEAALHNPHLNLRVASGGSHGWSSAAVAARIIKPPLPPSSKVKLAALTATGRISWNNTVTATVALTAQDMISPSLHAGRMQGRVRLDWQPKTRILSASGAGGITDVMTSWRPLAFAKLRWNAQARWDGGRRLTVDSLTLDEGRLALTGAGALDLKSGRVDATGRLTGDLSRLTAGWRSGRARLDLTLAATAAATRLTVAGDAMAATGGGRLDALGAIKVTGTLAMGRQTAAVLSFRSPAVTFNGTYKADAARAVLLVTNGAAVGRLLGVGLADGSRATLDYRNGRRSTALLRLHAPWLGAADGGLRRVAVAAHLVDLSHAPQGGVVLTASSPLGPLRVVSALQGDQKKVVLRDIMIDSPVATVLGGLTVERVSGLVSGHLEGASGDLAALRRGAGIDAGGAVRLDLSFAPAALDSGAVQAISGMISGHALTLVLAGRERVSAEALSIDGRLLIDPRGGKGRFFRGAQGAASVRDYRSSTLRLKEGTLVFAPTSSGAFPWRLALNGDYYGALDLKASGDFTVATGARLRLADLSGALAGRALALRHPTAVTWGSGGWRLDETELALGEGRAVAAAAVSAHYAAARVDLRDADLGLISVLTGRSPLAGVVSGALDLKIAPRQASGTFSLTARGVTEAANDGLSPRFDIDLSGDLHGAGETPPLDLKAALKGAGIAAHLSLRVPVRVRQNTSLRLAVLHDAPIRGALDWDGPLSPLILLTNLTEDVFDGALSAKVAIAGTLDAPTFNGGLRLRDGRYENLRWGAALKEVNAEATLAGQTLHLTRLTARDANGGAAAASGTLTLAGHDDVTGHLAATLDRVRLLRVGSVTASASGQLSYDRTADDAALTGALKVDEAEISLSKKLPSEIAVLAVREINGPTTMAVVENGAHALPTFNRLDLDVTAGRRVWVRGRGLDSEWRGALRVRGDAADPSVDGALAALRGTFDFAGKTFTLTDGGLRFTGGRDIDPAISLRAEHATFDFKAILALGGTLSRPTVSLSSDPALPQDEVMARILFGAGVQSLTPVEAVQLASAASSLSSGGGWDVFAVARKALSLDRLAVGAANDRSAGAEVTGGKYLTDRVYLELRTNTETGAKGATLRVDVTKHLQVESDVGSQDSNRLGLRWKKDY